MKDKEKFFRFLRDAVETPAESEALENFIRKINREMPPIEIIDDTHKKFDGSIYHLSKHDGRYYLGTSLTRSVWKFFNGEIPIGYEVHHSDDDKYNDDISNLILLSHEEHLKLHADKRRGVKTFREPKLKKFVCETCGKEFEAWTTNGLRHYCSDECHKKHREANNNYMTERTCEVCGKKFRAYKGHPTTHCSEECVAKSLQRRETRICLFCGKTFEVVPNLPKKFCSKECAESIKFKPHELRQCPTCGKSFEVTLADSRKYCSKDCVSKSQQRRPDKQCPICGKSFTVPASRVKQKYCSPQCANVARRKSKNLSAQAITKDKNKNH